MRGSAWRLGRRLPCGRDAVADRYVIEPAASRVACGLVETGDIRLEIDDGCAVDQVDAGEPYGEAGHVKQPDKAESDWVDPPWPPGGEYALFALLGSEQEGNLPERRRVTGLGQPMQPGQQPGVVELGQPVQALPVAVVDFDGPVLGPVELRLDGCRHRLHMSGAHNAYDLQWGSHVHSHKAATGSPRSPVVDPARSWA